MKGKKVCILMAVVIASVIAMSAGAVFAKYPEKPIRVIVAYSPGGGTDVSFRLLAKHAEKYVGVPLVVENRPGAGGEVGFTALAMAKPDGYTIGGINTTPVVAIPIERKAKFTLDSFEPILIVMDDPCVWAVKADSPFQSLKDVVDEAKKHKKPVLTIGTSGIGGDDHLAVLAFERQAGIKLVHVPFAGAAPARAALLGGHISLWGGNLGEAVLLHEAGELRMLGLMAKDRHRFASYLPTYEEQGYPVYMESTRGIAAPAGIAEEKLDFLIDAFSKAMADPDFITDAKKMKLPLGKEKGKEYLARLKMLEKMSQEIWEEHPWK
jgi:tripartite-type tricarboxylate transporter receptor subunit TctC